MEPLFSINFSIHFVNHEVEHIHLYEQKSLLKHIYQNFRKVIFCLDKFVVSHIFFRKLFINIVTLQLALYDILMNGHQDFSTASTFSEFAAQKFEVVLAQANWKSEKYGSIPFFMTWKNKTNVMLFSICDRFDTRKHWMY